MSLLKNQQDGSSGDPFTVAGTLVSSGTVDITGAFRLDGTAGASGQALVSAGGSNTPTWSTLGTMAAQNSTTVAITGGTITGITDLTVADGGTGASSITANSVILGNGTSALSGNLVAPSTSGNVLTSNGTTWTSAALPTGGVTSLNGQTGAITDTDQYAIGSYVTGRPQDVANYTNNTTIAGSSLYVTSLNNGTIARGSSTWSAGANQSLINTGTWRCLGSAYGNGSTAGYPGLWVRIS
jgi:hypothetical protein